MKNPEVSSLKKKLCALYSPESRSYKKRLLIASLAVFSVLFTVCIYGPFEMYQSLQSMFPFYLDELLICMGLLSLVLLMLGSPLIALFKGRLFDISVSLVFALSLCLYAQRSFLNIDLGLLDGRQIIWPDYAWHSLTNLAVWFVLFTVVFTLLYFNRKVWQHTIQFVSILLVIMQLGAFVNLLITIPEKPRDHGYILSMENQFQLSSEKNVVILSLDSFCGDTMEELEALYPGMLDSFADFTLFRNYSSAVCSTFYAVSAMLTGQTFKSTETRKQFFDSSWDSDSAKALYSGLKEQNYERNLFVNFNNVVGSPENIMDHFDNLKYEKRQIAYKSLITKMLRLSAYRCVPMAIKPSFWMASGEMNEILPPSLDCWKDWVDSTNYAFHSKLLSERLHTTEDKNVFIMYHLVGAHPPFRTDENGFRADTDHYRASRGSLRVVEEYLAQMKELGIYDDATIIVTSDHCDKERIRPSTLLMIKRSGETHEKTAVNQAPVTQIDFHPTLMDLLGIDHKPYGRSVYDVSEDEIRTRIWHLVSPDHKRYTVLYEYEFDCHVDILNVNKDYDKIDYAPPTRLIEMLQ